MKPAAAFLLAIALLSAGIAAQQILPSHVLVHGGLGFIDDVVASPTGEVYLSFPAQGFVGRETVTAGGVIWTPVASGFVLAMELEPSGAALWIADYMTGDVSRVDLGTGQITRTLTGFGFPIDIAFRNANSLLVGTVSTPNNISGIGSIYEVDLQAPPGTPPQLLATGFPGAVDMEVNVQGRLFVIAFGSPIIHEVNLVTHAVTPLAGGLLQPSDLIRGPGNTLYVCTLVTAEVLRFDPTALTPYTQIEAPVGGVLGPGCEDMALDPNGQLLVSMTNGELYRVLLENPVVKEGYPLSGSAFDLVVNDPAHTLWSYQLLASLGTASLPVGTIGVMPIAPDFLFQESLNPSSIFFNGFAGALDGRGRASGTVQVPVLPAGMRFDAYFGVAIFDLSGSAPQILLPDFIGTEIFAL